LHHNCDAKETFVKTANLPALRVSPALREAAESVLRPDESLSRLMETALQTCIDQRQADEDFIARGIRSADSARQSGVYVTSQEVMQDLRDKLSQAQQSTRKP
jgi:predicted transcriptional regulator